MHGDTRSADTIGQPAPLFHPCDKHPILVVQIQATANGGRALRPPLKRPDANHLFRTVEAQRQNPKIVDSPNSDAPAVPKIQKLPAGAEGASVHVARKMPPTEYTYCTWLM